MIWFGMGELQLGRPAQLWSHNYRLVSPMIGDIGLLVEADVGLEAFDCVARGFYGVEAPKMGR